MLACFVGWSGQAVVHAQRSHQCRQYHNLQLSCQTRRVSALKTWVWRRQPDLWAGVLPHWLPAVHGAYARFFAFVLTDPSEHPGFLRMFGLRGGQAPTAVIYDTRAPPRGAKFALGGDLEEAALVAFLDGFLRRKLQPMKEEL